MKGFLCKLVPLALWVCLPSAVRLMLQTSQQICFCYDEWNFDVSEVLFYSGPLAKQFINLTLENTVVYLIWEDSSTLDLKMTQKPRHDLAKFHSRESTGDYGQRNRLPSKIHFSESLVLSIHNFYFSATWVTSSTCISTGPWALRFRFYSYIEFLFTMFMMFFWAIVFYSYFCHSVFTSANHFWITDAFWWTE